MTRPIHEQLDPEIAAALEKLNLANGRLSSQTLAKARAFRAALPPPALSDRVQRVDHIVATRPDVSVRVHHEIGAGELRPAIYWMHGGGLVLGTNRIDDLRFDEWCPTLGCVGASVEYGLAPESPYPGPLEDCYAGLAWLHGNAQQLGIDSTRIGIGGSSAGAGLAAALTLLARDRGELEIAFQALIYPMLDDRQMTVSSQWRDPVWPPEANQFGWESYLRGLTPGEPVPSYAAPARATDLTGLPPAFVSVGALDVFADEDIEYATRLRHSSVSVELHVYPGAPHGFDSLMPNTRIGRQARRDIENWLVVQLADRGIVGSV